MAQKELDRREVISHKAGSLAEASLELMDIFKQADEAAEIYLENLKNLKDIEKEQGKNVKKTEKEKFNNTRNIPARRRARKSQSQEKIS